MMKKTKLVFSLVREQSIFMTAVIAILSFLSIVAFGISLSIGSGVIRWNSQWNKYATVQVMKADNVPAVKQVFTKYNDKIESVRELTKQEMENLIKPWISSGAKLNNYLPQMFEVKVKDSKSMNVLK
jgi:cell division protein FtsX